VGEEPRRKKALPMMGKTKHSEASPRQLERKKAKTERGKEREWILKPDQIVNGA